MTAYGQKGLSLFLRPKNLGMLFEYTSIQVIQYP